MAEKLYKVAGFTFTDENGAREALKEQKTIEYIESKTNMKDPRMINKVYHQIVDQNMFHTPVGFAYINKLKYLLEEIEENNTNTSKSSISKNSSSKNSSNTGFSVTKSGSGAKKINSTAEKKENLGTEVQVSEKQIEVLYEKLDEKDKKIKRYKTISNLFITLSAILAACVIGMFIINSTIGSPTILNYEEKIINKYATWEQQLIEKENELNKKLQELNK